MVLLAGLALTVHGAPTESFRAGFAEKDITPAIGMEMPGNYMKVFHKALHDPCKVRAVVFDDGKSVVALVGVDALMVPRPLVATVRKEIQEGSLVSLPLGRRKLRRAWGILHCRGRRLNLAEETFIGLCESASVPLRDRSIELPSH